MAVFTGTNSGEIIPSLPLAPVVAAGDDIINALGGNDIAIGWTGNDVISGGAGADVVIGGILNVVAGIGSTQLAGIDTADYSTSSGGVTIDLSSTSNQVVNSLGIQLLLDNVASGHGGDADRLHR